MELREYLSVLAKRRRLLVGVFLATMAVALAVTLLRPATWTAGTTLRVEPQTSLVGGSVQADDVEYLDRLVNTYARLATSGQMADRLTGDLRLSEPPKVAFEQLANTNLVELRVTTRQPDTAVAAARRAATLLITEIRALAASDAEAAERSFTRRADQLEARKAADESELARLDPASERALLLKERINGTAQRLSALRSDHERYASTTDANARGVTVVTQPTQPLEPSNRNIKLALAIGFVLAAIAGPGLAFIAENLSRRFRSDEEIEESVGLPILSSVPMATSDRGRVLFNSHSPEEEAFRRLRTSLLLRPDTSDGRMASAMLVTSALPGEGKSTVAANLGRTLAQTGRPTLVVDADLRLPSLHRFFSMDNVSGLSDLLRSEGGDAHRAWRDLVQATGVPNLALLPAGPPVDDPSTLLGGTTARRLFAEMATAYTYMVVDSPAVLAVTDPLVLTRNVETVLLVAGAHVDRDALRKTRQELSRIDATVLGIIVNGAEHSGLNPYLDKEYGR